MNEIPAEIKQALLQNEIAQWQQSLYVLQVRYRVQAKIGAGKEILAALTAEMERCEKALDALQEESIT